MALSKTTNFILRYIADLKGLKLSQTETAKLEKRLKSFEGQNKLTSKSSATLGDNLRRLGGRALLTIPIWFALRSAIAAIVRPLVDGARRVEEFSIAMQKVKVTILGSTNDMVAALNEVGLAAEQLAIKTGRSAAELVNVFQKFATVGLDVQTSLDGMTAATQLSVIMQGNAVEIGRTLALTYRLLGSSMDKTVPKQQQMQVIAANLSILWKTNAFEVGEFTQSLQNFLATAKITNTSLDETLTLLALLSTAGLQSGRGGRLIRTSFQKFEQNISKVNDLLGITIRESDNTFDSFIGVLGKIKELEESGKGGFARDIVREIFGGVRGGEPVKALIALFDKFTDELEHLQSLTPEEKIEQLNRSMEAAKDTVAFQLAQFRELRTQLGKTFLIGVAGADNFLEALKLINDRMQILTDNTRIYGVALRAVLSTNNLGTLFDPRRTIHAIKTAREEIEKIRTEIQAVEGKKFLSDLIDEGSIRKIRLQLEKLQELQGEGETEFLGIPIASAFDDLIVATKDLRKEQENAANTSINQQTELEFQTKQRLLDLEAELELAKQKALGLSKATIAQKELNKEISVFVRRFNESLVIDAKTGLTRVKNISEQIDKMAFSSAVVAGEWQKVRNLLAEVDVRSGDAEKKIREFAASLTKAEKASLEISANLSKDFRETFTGGLQEALQEGDFLATFGQGIRNALAEAFAETLTESLFEPLFKPLLTGLSAALTGTRIRLAHISGGGVAASLMQKAHLVGGAGAAAQVAAARAAGGAGSLIGPLTQSGSFLSGGAGGAVAAGGALATALPIIGAAIAVGAIALSIKQQRDAEKAVLRSKNITVTGPRPLEQARFNTTGIGISIGLLATALGTDRQAARNIGREGRKFNKSTFFGFAGLAFAGLTNKSSAVQTTVEEFRVASRVDVTNSKLDIVNRNLTALRTTFETFILPQSAFFSESRGTLEDQFSIDGRRGGTG